MKKTLLKLLILSLSVSAVLCLCACGHSHSFDSQVISNEYLASSATCTEKAVYYYSCECGEKGTETFEHGEELGHEFTNYVSDNNATYDNDGTKTAICNRDGCDETDTVADIGTKLESHISFKTLSLEEKNVFANSIEEFSFANEIQVFGNSTFAVASDKYGADVYLTKVVPLSCGDNTFYIFESIDNEIVNTYTVVLRRRPMYNVSFSRNDAENQIVEEGCLATEPETAPTRAGYTFDGWDFDFTTPIERETIINAKWTANTATPYKIEYYLQNLEDDNYTLSETEDKTGTTDTTAIVTPKTIEHFTFNSYSSSTSKNINGDGSTVLKLYYTRNKYNVTLNAINNKGSVSGGGRYANAEQVTAIATVNTGYTFDGWYNGEEKASNELTYKFNPISDITLTAKWSANTDTPYKVEHYLENLEDDNYTLSETEDKTGTTDTTATVTPKSIEHFTFNSYSSSTSKNINGDGSTILKLYYTRNKYNVSINNSTNAGITNSGTYKYGTELSSTVTVNLGYDFVGWFNGDDILTEETTYEFTVDRNVMAKIEMKEEMKIFDFISDTENCEITGVKDKTVTDVVIPNIVTSIGYEAFVSCESLTSVTFDDNSQLTSIGDYAFAWCYSLETIEIPNSVTGIGNDAFNNCSSLTSINFSNNSQLTSIGENAFYVCQALETIKIPKSVTRIDYCTFYGCESLETIEIPNSVTRIGDYVFFACCSLTSIEIPNSVTSIGDGAFV